MCSVLTGLLTERWLRATSSITEISIISARESASPGVPSSSMTKSWFVGDLESITTVFMTTFSIQFASTLPSPPIWPPVVRDRAQLPPRSESNTSWVRAILRSVTPPIHYLHLDSTPTQEAYARARLAPATSQLPFGAPV